MSDTTATHRDRVIDLAHRALDTQTGTQLAHYQALLALIALVAGPGGHLDQAIDLVTNRRDEAETIAAREFEQLTSDKQLQFKVATARQTALAMTVAADMLARTGCCLDTPDAYDIPPDVVAVVAATLATSGLLKDAVAIISDPDS
jgi:hypothetical protein